MSDQEKIRDGGSRQPEPEEDKNLGELRNSMRTQLNKSGLTTLIRDMVRNVCASQEDVSALTPDDVIQEVYRKGMMSDFIQKLKATHPADSKAKSQTTEIDEVNKHAQFRIRKKVSPAEPGAGDQMAKSKARFEPNKSLPSEEGSCDCENYFWEEQGPMDGKYFLKMEILGAKAFVEHLFDDKLDINGHSEVSKSSCKFVLHVFYKSQRFRSEPVVCRCEPKFNDIFMIELGSFQNGSIFQLLTMNEPLRIILVRDRGGHDEGSFGCATLVSHCLHDWRPVLMSETSSRRFLVELMGIGPEHRIPVGLLSIRLSILPTLQEQLTESTYWSHLAVEKTGQDEADRLFLTYAKQWWREYLEIRPEHQNRLVKLFSYDENTISRPLTSFVKPLIADRLFPTPYHALRFVRLLPISSENDTENLLRLNSSVAPKVPGTANILSNHWQSLESTLAAKSGSIEDHAILLCDLLLGFGFDAYVGIGIKVGEIPWVWVITFDENYLPTFWEASTGEKFQHLLPDDAGELVHEKLARLRRNDEVHKFKAVSCIFNNKCFLANIQASDLIELTDWHLQNPSRWKKLQELSSSTSQTGSGKKILEKESNYSPSLFPNNANPIVMALELETQLKLLISSTRRNHSLQTKWDDGLSKLIGQESARSELAACSGISKDLFPSHLTTAILHRIPRGHDYKSCPFEFTTGNPASIFFACLNHSACEQEIILCRGEDVYHSVRADVFLYPEDVMSVRVIIACKFISVA